MIVIADTLKPDSVDAVSSLKKQGAETIMLTGDREAVAAAIAKQVGVTRYRAGMLPGDKVEAVETLLSQKRKNRVLVFVGDGINDVANDMEQHNRMHKNEQQRFTIKYFYKFRQAIKLIGADSFHNNKLINKKGVYITYTPFHIAFYLPKNIYVKNLNVFIN